MPEAVRRFVSACLLVLGLVRFCQARQIEGPRRLELLIEAAFLAALAAVRL
ncbi:MAG: hypothetical protein NUW23_02405 [Firmicutes bacterium]|jgi:hypothetical protein|nr:hypothetical protein [Bacillota bacterium]